MSRRLLAVLAPVAAVSLLLAACGDDDGDDDASTTTTEALAGDEGDGAGGDDTSTTGEGGATTEPDEGATTAPDGGEVDVERFCTDFEAVGAMFEGIDDEDIASVRSGLADISTSLRDLGATAPEELTDELELLADAIDDLRAEAEATDSVEEFEEAAEPIFTAPEYDEAGQTISEWTDESCPAGGGDDG